MLIPRENPVVVVSKILSLLRVNVTSPKIERDLLDHPDYPSLLSVSDVLTKYGIENISFKASHEKLNAVPLPFLVPLKSSGSSREQFTIVSEVDETSLTVHNPQSWKKEKVSLEAFSERWKNQIIMAFDATNAMGEENYKEKNRHLIYRNLLYVIGLLAIPAFVLANIIGGFYKDNEDTVHSLFYVITSIFGCLATILILLLEVDQDNPVARQVCGSDFKHSCDAVLNSKASKLFGISWSAIGFTYFFGSLCFLSLNGVQNSTSFSILSILSLLSIPYAAFSITYQRFVIKQWCRLCILVQLAVISQFTLILPSLLHKPLQVDFRSINILVISFGFSFIISSMALFLSKTIKNSKELNAKLKRLKHSPEIFNAILSKQPVLIPDSGQLGIRLGNPNAKNKIVKVCNPFCGPCASAHMPMEQLLEQNDDLEIQIIFTATPNISDRAYHPVLHLLAISDSGNDRLTRKYLDDWYGAKVRDYNLFSSSHPLSQDPALQHERIVAMREWCDKAEIRFTPTFFVNGFQLPEMYSVSDLKYFLSA